MFVLQLVWERAVGSCVVSSVSPWGPALHHQDGQGCEHLPRLPRAMAPNLLNTTGPHLPVENKSFIQLQI